MDPLGAARGAIQEWVHRPGFDALLQEFGGSATAHALGRVAGAVVRHESWALGNERSGPAVQAAERGDVLYQRLVGLEEFASFCWNTRSGMPRAILHLLAAGVGTEDDLASNLPALAEPDRWHPARHSDLLTVFGGSAIIDLGAELADAVAEYPDVSATGYRERWQGAAVPYPVRVQRLVHRAADDLGLVTPGVPTGDYDDVIVLGGGGTSPWIRAHFAAELIDRHALRPSAIWLLGSPRPIDPAAERDLIRSFVTENGDVDRRYCDASEDEFDLMAIGAEAAFHVSAFEQVNLCGCTDVTVPCPHWQAQHGRAAAAAVTDPRFQHSRRRTYAPSGRPPIHVLSSSTGRPPDRPNTADTYRLLAEVTGPLDGRRALVVTTQVFVPFQRFDAIRMLQLPTGLELDVVGFGADRGDRRSTAEFELQEILSGLRSARRLADVISGCPATDPPAAAIA